MVGTTSIDKSLMEIRSNKGPKSGACGKPVLTDNHSDV